MTLTEKGLAFACCGLLYAYTFIAIRKSQKASKQ